MTLSATESATFRTIVNATLTQTRPNARTLDELEAFVLKFFTGKAPDIKQFDAKYFALGNYSKHDAVSSNELVNAIHDAFNKHLSLIFTPYIFKTLRITIKPA